MLAFNENGYLQLLTQLGLKATELYPYKELLTSEIAYQNHFLHYLHDEDVSTLLKAKGREQLDLQEIYRCLKALREAQLSVMEVLYQPHPENWLQALKERVPHYEHYFKLTLGMLIPEKMDAIFKKIQTAKIKEHHPQLGSLSAVLIAPVQRFPRYYLLGRELLKALDKKLSKTPDPDQKLMHFRQELVRFVDGISNINQQMNDMMKPEEERDDEPTSPYMQPSGRLHPLRNLKRMPELSEVLPSQDNQKRIRP